MLVYVTSLSVLHVFILNKVKLNGLKPSVNRKRLSFIAHVNHHHDHFKQVNQLP